MDLTLEEIVRRRSLTIWRRLATEPFEIPGEDDPRQMDSLLAPLEAGRDRFGDQDQMGAGAQPS